MTAKFDKIQTLDSKDAFIIFQECDQSQPNSTRGREVLPWYFRRMIMNGDVGSQQIVTVL